MKHKCKTCGAPIKRKTLTAAEFKKKFNVGDRIFGYATDLEVTITSIGVNRFLYKTARLGKERVGSMTSATANWRAEK